MATGVDYAWARPTVQELHDHGVTFVCRYVTDPDNGKSLTKPEADTLTKAGIGIVSVWEITAGRALSGHQAGLLDGSAARRFATAAGAPEDSPIYYTVDTEIDAAHLGLVGEYFQGVRAADTAPHIGGYGSFDVCAYLFGNKLCEYLWQTYAWSHGQWFAHAQLRQTTNGIVWGDAQVDLDQSMTEDIGAWPTHVTPPSPPAPPGRWYVVVAGDTLSEIAVRFNVGWQVLATVNHIPNPDRIYPGQRLYIPGGTRATYTVVAGDTVWGIAQRFHTTVEHIVTVNNLRNPNLIYPGQVLYL